MNPSCFCISKHTVATASCYPLPLPFTMESRMVWFSLCVLYFVFTALHFVFCILYFSFKYSVAIASCWPSHRRGRRNHVVSHSLFTPNPPFIISICIDICISLIILQVFLCFLLIIFLPFVNCMSCKMSHSLFTPTPPFIISICIDLCISLILLEPAGIVWRVQFSWVHFSRIASRLRRSA